MAVSELLTSKPITPSLKRVTFQEYLDLPRSEQESLHRNAYRQNREWIRRTLAELKVEWMMVLGGKIIRSSRTLRDYPSPKELEQIAREHDEIPYVFVRDLMIEEVGWSPTALGTDDYYPTLSVLVGAEDWDKDRLQDDGLVLTADFDTGSPYEVFNYDLLVARGLVVATPFDLLHESQWLQRSYDYFVHQLTFAIPTDTGISSALRWPCRCVLDWQNSPLCDVNPNRQVLVGRSLPLALGCVVELNFGHRTTRVQME